MTNLDIAHNLALEISAIFPEISDDRFGELVATIERELDLYIADNDLARGNFD